MSSYFDDTQRFVMIHQARDLEALLDALAARELQHRDISVFVALISLMDRYGRVRITAVALSERLAMAYNVCLGCLGRLKKQAALVRVYDRSAGAHYFILNPWVASVGSPQARGHLWEQFKAALEENSSTR